MKTINKIKKAALAAAALFALLALPLSCDNGALFGGGGGDEYAISLAPDAVGTVVAGQQRGLENDVVTVYAKPGITPEVIRINPSEDGKWKVPAQGMEMVTDKELLGEIGLSSARTWTFIMPKSDIVIRAHDDTLESTDVIVRAIRITSEGSGQGISELVYQNGSVVPTQIEIKAPWNKKLTVKVTLAAGVTGKYGLSPAAGQSPAIPETALGDDGTFTINAISQNTTFEFTLEATKGDTTNVYPFLLYTSENRPLSTNADLAKLTISGFTGAIRDIYASPAVNQFNPSNIVELEMSDMSVSEVTIVPVAASNRATMQVNGGNVVSGAARIIGLPNRGSNFNVIEITVTAENASVASKVFTVKIKRPLSSENRLSSLSVPIVGDFNFKPDDTDYDLNPAGLPPPASLSRHPYLIGMGNVYVRPVLMDDSAKLFRVNTAGEMSIESGSVQAYALNLDGTATTIKFKVVPAESTAPSKTYMLKLYYDSSLEQLDEFSPKITDIEFSSTASGYNPINTNFAQVKKNYDFKNNPVPSNMQKIKVTVNVEIPMQNGEPVVALFFVNSSDPSVPGDNGKIYADIPLPNYGELPNEIVIIAQGQSSKTTYVLRIYRSASDDAHLASLSIKDMEWQFTDSAGTNDWSYDFDDGAYILPDTALSVTLTPTVRYSTTSDDGKVSRQAAMYVNGTLWTSGTPYTFVLYGFGDYAHEIEILVTAEDGTTTKKYKLTFYRSADGNADLTNIVTANPQADAIGISFVAGNTSYSLNEETAAVPYYHNVVYVTATTKSPTSSILITDSISGTYHPSGMTYNWVLDGDGLLQRTQSTLYVKVIAQNRNEIEYTLTVWREAMSSDNVELLRISVSVETTGVPGAKTNYNARVYPPVSAQGKDDEYKLYAPAFSGRKFSISGVTLDPNATATTNLPNVEFTSSNAPFNENNKPYWTEYTLTTPVTITVTPSSTDSTAERVYTIKKLVFTPGAEWDRVPMAKGGTISFIDASTSGNIKFDELHSFTATGKDVLEFLGYVPTTAGRFLLNGGGGSGGKNDDEDSGPEDSIGGGGGGGGGGGVIERSGYVFANKKTSVVVGAGGKGNGEKFSNSGEDSKYDEIFVSSGGGGGHIGGILSGKYDDEDDGEDKWVIGGSPSSTNRFVFASPVYTEFPGVAGGGEGAGGGGATGGDVRKFVHMGTALAEIAGSAVSVLVYVMLSKISASFAALPTAGLELVLAISSLIVLLQSIAGAWLEYGIGAPGGGGAKTQGSSGERYIAGTVASNVFAKGGAGGAGLKSDISGNSVEYGAGGAGGDSSESDNGKPGLGGNGSTTQDGTDGKFLARWKWDEVYR